MARSAQLAMVENNSMRDRLRFIEGRHEPLHLYFVLVDIIQDLFSDPDNLQEPSSLATMIQVLNPKLMKKKGKEDLYAFKAVYNDIYVALISQFQCSFLKVDNLSQNCNPEALKKLEKADQQKGYEKLFRSFIKKTHPEFENCMEED